MRFKFANSCREQPMIRAFGDDGEIAYACLGLKGLQATIELPNDWHEQARAWVHLGCGFFTLAFSLKAKRVGEDNHQCQGHTYGFQFYDDLLWLRWGEQTGTRESKHKAIYMPWHWKFREHVILSEPETHPYTYTLRSGEKQLRTATIQKESRSWSRFWLPSKITRTSIDVKFSDEVGERSGSWKGGVLGCSYEVLPNELPLEALRRMERERKF